MDDIERRQTMKAELAPDCYAGKDGEEIAHQWSTSCEGDMGDGGILDTISLGKDLFPPGTTVTIEEPVCPKCHEVRYPETVGSPSETTWPSKCSCGFDWEAWTIDQYS